MSATLVGTSERLGTEPPRAGSALTPRRARPVLWWASLGAAAVVLQAWIYTSWILSDDFRAVTTGADPVPGHEKTWAWILQATFTAGALFAVVFVVRKCVAQRRLTLEAKIAIAWLAAMWMDPMANYFRPQYMFNSYYINFGSWAGHIPGWISREGGNLPFALGINLPSYTASVLAAIAGCKLMQAVRARRPRMGTAGLVLIAWLFLSAVVFAVEDLLIRTGWLVWNGIPSVTLWGGGRWAMPLTEVLVWGGTQTALATLLFLKDDKGRVFTERGLDRVTAPRWRLTAVSLFSVIGFATVAQAAYGIISAPLGFYVGKWTEVPSYIRNGVCGEGTPYQCPGPEVPVLLPGNPPGATAERPPDGQP
jgi:Spirocyclase AveC-like